MFAKRFFYVSAGILCLALAYHFGARSAGAQGGGQVVGFASDIDAGHCSGSFQVITSDGEVYGRFMSSAPCNNGATGPLTDLGNFWSGAGPTPVSHESLGSVKARYR